MQKYKSLEERLLVNSMPVYTGYMINDEPSDCWEWIGNRNYKGYGRLTLRVDGRHCKVAAHRASYETFMGLKLNDDDTIEHKCRFKACIHPNHLIPMSRSDNSKAKAEVDRKRRTMEAIFRKHGL